MIKVILGTANFFQEYGITQENSSNINIENILKTCAKFNINNLDTAINYEMNPEKFFISNNLLSKFNIGTKIAIKNLNSKKLNFLDDLIYSLEKSLNYWKKDQFEYIYCHDLLENKEQIELFNLVFNKLKSEGFTRSIGLSVYDLDNIHYELISTIDRIQIPDNLYLQRSQEEILFLKNLSLTVDVRSIFLQGVIPNNSINFKKKIPKDLLDHHNKVIPKSKEIGLDMYELAIQFIKKQGYSNVVIGVDNGNQIKQFIESFSSSVGEINFDYFKCSSKFVDPRLW